jgi:hypothetical protein
MAAKKKAVKRAAAKRPVVVKKSARKAPAKQTSLKLPRIGADWPGQAGKFMGIICGENGQPDYGIALPTDPRATLKGVYGPKENITCAQSELDGMANTKAMAAAGSKIAKDALAVKIDGHRDFYIPSRREARLLQINPPHADRGGVALDLHTVSRLGRSRLGAVLRRRLPGLLPQGQRASRPSCPQSSYLIIQSFGNF